MILIEIEAVVGDNNTALIILAKTGVRYTAQCGGMGCTHPEAEGYVINIGNFMQDFDTCNFGCWYIDRVEKYRIELRDAVNDYCSNNDVFGRLLKFDDSRISEVQEGWIPVKINGSLRFPEITFENEKGFIHNYNCD